MSLLPAVLDLNASSHSFIIDLHDCTVWSASISLNSTEEARFQAQHVISWIACGVLAHPLWQRLQSSVEVWKH